MNDYFDLTQTEARRIQQRIEEDMRANRPLPASYAVNTWAVITRYGESDPVQGPDSPALNDSFY